jgi:Tfp pilus assembly protein PilO
VTLTDRDRKLLLVIIPVALLAAFWFLVLSPKQEEADLAAEALAEQEQRRDTAQAAASSAQGAKRDFTADYTQIVRLGKAVPAQVDMPSLIVQLDAAAAGTGIQFTKIATGERQALPTQTTAPPADSSGSGTPVEAGGAQAQSQPGAAAESANNAQATANDRSSAAEQSGVAPSDTQTSTSSGGSLPVGGGTTGGTAAGTSAASPSLETIPLELEFIGDFFKLADFFHDVKRFVRVAGANVMVGGRLITIDAVRWSSDPEIFPRIRAEITATIYLSPKAEGTTAGATATGPAPEGTPATAPPAGAPEASPAPTATATGATP